MKLIDLKPRWFDVPGTGTDKDGMTFLCPHCVQERLHRCTTCGALWKFWPAGTNNPDVGPTWSHIHGSPLKECCDNNPKMEVVPVETRLAVQFANPIGAPPKPLMRNDEKHYHVHELRTFDVPPGFLWQREGETFETMTITPSVDASASGHWHGFVRNGETT